MKASFASHKSHRGFAAAGAIMAVVLPATLFPVPAQELSAVQGGDAVRIVDAADPAHGARVRQLRKDDGHEHNLYHYRDPWNADGSRMVAIWSDLQQKNWQVVLCDGDGRFLKRLFTIAEYDWRLVWDRRDPAILYTWKGADLYRYDVNAGRAERLKSFAPGWLAPAGPSLNQAGDRILAITNDHTLRSFRLPDMREERAFKADVPEGCFVDWGKPRYIGCRNLIALAYRSSDGARQALLVYDDTGRLVRKLDGVGGGGHYDFSPDGKLAYPKMPVVTRRGAPAGPEPALEIRVVNLDGSDDRALFSAPRSKAAYVQNAHVTWPKKVNDWFVVSFFPIAGHLPDAYAPPLDEIMVLRLDGTARYLARTGTAYSRSGPRGSSGDMFWAQPQACPSADGRRICFNSNRSGTIDLHIVYPENLK
ncbi:MAG: hypothetical protein N2689_01755 [Verrucomicrobiae bacterium]|nr:hypothetical protein [Verrucomicrobiae bacterium]